MEFDLRRTIVAISSGLAPAQRAIVRISGSQTRELLENILLLADEDRNRLNSTVAVSWLGRCDLGWEGRSIGLRVYFWPNNRSFTGEPCAELHLLGALPVVERLVARLLELGGAPANRGEFALRSFLAGKIDLTQAEAILGVIESEADQQLQWALQQLGGNISRPVRQLRTELVGLLAHLEAGLDFVEEDIEFISEAELSGKLQSILEQIEELAASLNARGTGSRLLQIALIGLPNAGKSSLFNALLGSNRAIVSGEAGTTRDAVSAAISLGEVTAQLVDTAGIEELQGDSPRAVAQGVLRRRLDEADVIVFCLDLGQPPSPIWLDSQLSSLRAMKKPLLLVGTKRDAAEDYSGANLPQLHLAVSVSQAETLQSMRELLRDALRDVVASRHTQAMHDTAVRCRHALECAAMALQRGISLIHHSAGEELVASEMRCALDDLASIIGEVHSDDVLGEIFSRFCIGK